MSKEGNHEGCQTTGTEPALVAGMESNVPALGEVPDVPKICRWGRRRGNNLLLSDGKGLGESPHVLSLWLTPSLPTAPQASQPFLLHEVPRV